MKTADVSNAIIKWSDALIDGWFEPMMQPLVKGIVNANVYKINNVISAFADESGEIDIDGIVNQYEKIIPPSGYNINASSIFGDNFFTRSLSIKVLERSDIETLKNLLYECVEKPNGVGKGK